MRKSSESITARNEPIVESIRAMKEEHPYWGYRRVWANLRYVEGLFVNKKRVRRLMIEHNLAVRGNENLKAKRTSGRSKPRPDRPNQWWGIDMTKMITQSGWVYIVIVLDWYTKKIVGHYSGKTSTNWHWLEALERGLNRQFPEGVRGHNLHLMSDNGPQPTSVRFMKACSRLDVHRALTSYNNPKGNADTERMIRTMKEELLWLVEWTDAAELGVKLDVWVEKYNRNYLHSALGYSTPMQAEKEYFDGLSFTLSAA